MSKFIASKISRVTDEENNVIVQLKVSGYNRVSAEMAVSENKQFEEITVEVKKKSSNRSLDQNALLWAMLSEIALHTAGSKEKRVVEQIYCAILEEAQAHYEYILAPKETEDGLRKAFRVIREIGQREVIDPKGNKRKGTLYQCFVGSSKYDTKEMTELIETALNKCAELGIDTSEVRTIEQSYKRN